MMPSGRALRPKRFWAELTAREFQALDAAATIAVLPVAAVEQHGPHLPLGVDMLYRARDKYPWLEMQTIYPFTEEGVSQAGADAMAMKTVKSTIVPWP